MKEQNSIDASQINYARILHILRETGGASRVDLTRQTGLSPATVTAITRDLIERGYVRTGAMKAAQRGRPPEILVYDAESRYALGIELHNHSLLGVITDLYAQPLHMERVPLANDSLEAILEAIQTWVGRATQQMADKECAGIGLAVPGAVEQFSGRVVYSTEFNLTSVPIVDLVQTQLRRSVTATNRTYAAMLAEVWHGQAQNARNALYIRLGNYIGGAVLINGTPFMGSAGTGAASIAHVTVDARGGLPCRCGSHGCLDTVASGDAMARTARGRIKTGAKSSLIERCDGLLDRITGIMVAEEARNGDELALEVVAEAAGWFGIAAGIAVNLMGLDTIIFGGDVGHTLGDLLTDGVHEQSRAYIYTVSATTVQFVTSQLGESAVASGAAATALWANLSQSINLHPA